MRLGIDVVAKKKNKNKKQNRNFVGVSVYRDKYCKYGNSYE